MGELFPGHNSLVPFSRKKYSVKSATDDWDVASRKVRKYIGSPAFPKYRVISGDSGVVPPSSMLNGFVM